MLEYGESYLKYNALWLRRFRLKCQLTDKLEIYLLAMHMARELEEEEEY